MQTVKASSREDERRRGSLRGREEATHKEGQVLCALRRGLVEGSVPGVRIGSQCVISLRTEARVSRRAVANGSAIHLRHAGDGTVLRPPRGDTG